jgi:hypothetical protein
MVYLARLNVPIRRVSENDVALEGLVRSQNDALDFGLACLEGCKHSSNNSLQLAEILDLARENEGVGPLTNDGPDRIELKSLGGLLRGLG